VTTYDETRQEFETRYADGMPGTFFGSTHVSLPCTCEDGGGPTHWAAIRNTPDAIEDHISHEKVLEELRKMNSD